MTPQADLAFVRAMAQSGAVLSATNNPWRDAICITMSKSPKHHDSPQCAAEALIDHLRKNFGVEPAYSGEGPTGSSSAVRWRIRYQNLPAGALSSLKFEAHGISSAGVDDPERYQVLNPD